MSLQSRPITFGRSQPQQSAYVQQQLQAQQAALKQQQQAQQSQAQSQPALSLPSNLNLSLPGPSSLALPGVYATPSSHAMPPPPFASKPPVPTNTTAGPSSLSPPAVAPVAAATPAPLTLEQQHITAVDGIVPTLQNIVATVNLDCRLDLKTIALHARNAEYNPKVSTFTI